jgi:hypothetical protein
MMMQTFSFVFMIPDEFFSFIGSKIPPPAAQSNVKIRALLEV